MIKNDLAQLSKLLNQKVDVIALHPQMMDSAQVPIFLQRSPHPAFLAIFD